MAVWRRISGNSLIRHTARGCHYASFSHRAYADTWHHPVHEPKGNCWNNTVSESFFHTLITNWLIISAINPGLRLGQDIFEYIVVFYNRERFHELAQSTPPEDSQL